MDVSCSELFSILFHFRENDMSKIRKLICDKCLKGFSHPQNLSRHKKIYKQSRSPEFQCEKRGSKFNRKDSLIRHEDGCKGKSKDPMCKSCNKSFQIKGIWQKCNQIEKEKKTETKSKNETASASRSFEPLINLRMVLEYLDSSDTDDDFLPTMVPLVETRPVMKLKSTLPKLVYHVFDIFFII